MKITKEDAQKNHDRIVQAGGQVAREYGLGAAGVAQIAAKADLTHGAVYRHFASKDAVLAAAITADFATIVDLLHRITAQGGTEAAYVAAYLAPDHRDHFPWGCPAAPLAAEVARATPEVQTAFTAGLHDNLSALARLINPTNPDTDKAIAHLATMVGAMALARATKATDPALSDRILTAAKQALT